VGVASGTASADLATAALPGVHAVTIIDSTWTDPARARALPVRLQVPGATATGLRPTIVLSHGLGGSRESLDLWGRHWASHGFIVIQLQHPGSDDALWRNRGTVPVKEALQRGRTPKAYTDRVADVRFAVDDVARQAGRGDPVAVRVDPSRLGISGHSFGARTTLAISGEQVPGLAGTRAWADPRFNAAVALSPTAPGAAADWPVRFGSIRIPFLSITGTDDGDPLGKGTPALRQEPWRHMPPPDKYLMVLARADHYVFSGGAMRGRDTRFDDAIQRHVRAVTLLFWQAWLEGNAQARAQLEVPAMRAALGDAGTWSVK
jgi:predicted dienelactone hydrolase